MRSAFFMGAVVLAAAVIAACGSKDRSYDDGSGAAGGPNGGAPIATTDVIAIEPADAMLDVTDTSTPSLDYHAYLVHPDGTRADVTAPAHFRIDPIYGTFAGAKFTAAPNAVGKATVHVDFNTLGGDTSLSLHLTKTLVTGGAPADAATKFGGTVDPAKKPAFVYPADGVMVPPNMNEIEWHYQPGPGNDLFELAVKGTLLDLKVYFGCTALGGGCAYTPDKTAWGILSSAGRGQDPLTTTLRGTTASGGAVGVSASQAISFGEEDILGGLYYWNAGAGATMRYEFGVSGQTAETYMNAPKAGAATCVGCHVLSRDGARISLGLDIPGPATYKVFDVATKAQVFGQGGAMGGSGANFFSFSPDNKQIMVSNGVSLSLRDAATGAAIQDNVGPGAMPDWAPDGNSIVFAKPKTSPPCFGAICGAPGVSEASLFLLTSTGSGWGNPTTLVQSNGDNAYYPSFSPEGDFVVFNRASAGTDSKGDAKSSYDAPDATVWAVPTKGGSPIALTRATSANGDSWPKWMHRAQNYRGKKLLWITFSSRRAYGLRQGAGQNAQIWMAAFDPEAAAQGKDPSYPAFRLPFQELSSGNHIAQWVTRVERKGCQDATQCDGSESCIDSVCRPTVH
jgi:hypothetical protein